MEAVSVWTEWVSRMLRPTPDFPVDALPRLTVRMVARLQSFPDEWKFQRRKKPRHIDKWETHFRR